MENEKPTELNCSSLFIFHFIHIEIRKRIPSDLLI